jgi:PAS domain S-box-containing protein
MNYEDMSKEELIGRIKELERKYNSLQEVEQKLERKTRQFSALVENLPGMGYTCLNDAHWTMVFISRGCRDLIGYAPEELIGNQRTSYNKIIHPDDREYVWEQIQRAVENKESFRLLYRVITADGEEKWVWEKGMGVFDENGELANLQGFIHDIRG